MFLNRSPGAKCKCADDRTGRQKPNAQAEGLASRFPDPTDQCVFMFFFLLWNNPCITDRSEEKQSCRNGNNGWCHHELHNCASYGKKDILQLYTIRFNLASMKSNVPHGSCGTREGSPPKGSVEPKIDYGNKHGYHHVLFHDGRIIKSKHDPVEHPFEEPIHEVLLFQKAPPLLPKRTARRAN